jgi:hypothetical protein
MASSPSLQILDACGGYLLKPVCGALPHGADGIILRHSVPGEMLKNEKNNRNFNRNRQKSRGVDVTRLFL